MELDPEAEPDRLTEPADGVDGVHDWHPVANAGAKQKRAARAKRYFFKTVSFK